MRTVTFAGFTAQARTVKAAMAQIEADILRKFEELQDDRIMLFVTDQGHAWKTTFAAHRFAKLQKGQTIPMMMMMTARQVLHEQGRITRVQSFPFDSEAEYQATRALTHSFEAYPSLTDPAIPRVRCGTCESVWLDNGKNKGCTNPACEENPALDESWRESHRLERRRRGAYHKYTEARKAEEHYTIPMSEPEFNNRWNLQNNVTETDRKLSRKA